MAVPSVIVHHLSPSARMLDNLGRYLFHHRSRFGFGIGGIPVHVVGNMTVAIVSAQAVPILLVSVVTTGVFAIDCRLRVTVRPNPRNVVRRLDPPTEARHVTQAGGALRTARKADELDLHRGAAVGFRRARRVPHRARRLAGIDMLVDRQVVDGEMRNVLGLAIRRKRPFGARTLGRVMHDLERMASDISSG